MFIVNSIKFMKILITILIIPWIPASFKISALKFASLRLYDPFEFSKNASNFFKMLNKKLIDKQTLTLVNNKRSIHSPIEHLMRNTCNENIDCYESTTICDRNQGLCTCPYGYIPADLTVPTEQLTIGSYESRFCYKLKKIGEPCEHHVQCFVPHSICQTINHLGKIKSGHHNGTCNCKFGFRAQGKIV